MKVVIREHEEGNIAIEREDSVVVLNISPDGIAVDLYAKNEDGDAEGLVLKSWYYLNEDLTGKEHEPIPDAVTKMCRLVEVLIDDLEAFGSENIREFRKMHDDLIDEVYGRNLSEKVKEGGESE